MAKYSNVVEYNIVTDVDTSGITKLQNELTKLKQSLKFDKDSFNTLGFDNAKIDQSIKKVNQLQTALTAAFNPKIGTLDLSKLNTSLQKEHTSLQMIVKDWEMMGSRGNMAISSLSNALLSMNKGAVTVNTTLSKIANTFSNTVRWGITASIFQEMMSSVQGAVSYMKNLDESLTQIQMVTNSSKENMRELAQYANNAAQALGSTTVDYTNAVKVFVQEGFSESESKQYANLSTKLANVSEQNTATTSDQITAFRNAFQLDYEQTVAAMDKVANVANNTASNVNELMTASQRAASVAQAVGSSQDSFLAAIATIESVTRQSAEEIGNGLKTIYQRFADIKTGKTLEDGVQYGQYANALKSIGVDVLDAAGEFKGMDQILKETQEVWSSLSETMKVAVGEKVAGKFQYNRFAALMNNQAYYEKALAATGESSEGMMDQMNEIYMDSIEGRLKTLQAAGEQVMSTLFNQDDVEPVIETLTDIVNAINDIVDAAGGLQGVLPVVGGLLMRTFSTQIAGSITNIATSIQTILANSRNANNLSVAVDLMGLRGATKESPLNAQLTAGVADNYSSLSESTREKLRDLSQQILELEEEKNNVLKEQQAFIEDINMRATEEQRLAREKIEIDEEDLILKKEEIEDLERIKILVGSLPIEEEKRLQYLKEDVANLENIKTDYDKIVQACSIYNEQLLRGEALGEEQLKVIKQWKNELNGIGINTVPLDNLIIKAEQLENVTKNTERTVKDILNTTTLEAKLNNITRAVGGLSSAFIGIHMLGEMVDTLFDKTATAEEKFTAITMNGLMGITMLLPAVIDFVKAIAAAKEGSLAFAAAERVRAAASAMANGALLLNPVVLGIMAAVAAAAIAIAVAHEAIFGAVDKANRKFEEQQNILKQTKESYKALSEKVEDLDKKIESISDGKQALSEMAKGTEEWKNKVAELNDQIYELLEAYPELIEYIKSEDGVLSLDTDNDGYKQYIADLKNQKLQARQVNLLQQGNVKKAENNVQLEEFKLKYGDFGFTLNDIANKSINDLTDSLDSNKNNYDSAVIALTDLKQSVDATNIYLDNIDNTVSSSLGYSNYAGTKISDYENPDLSQYQTVRTINTAHKKNLQFGLSQTVYDTQQITEWNANNEILQKAIKQQYANLKDITGITSKNTINGSELSFKYTDEEGNLKDKTISEAEVKNALTSYVQTIEYTTESFKKNAEIFELFGAKTDYNLREIRDSAGNLITSLNQLDTVTQEQAAAMSKLEDSVYNNYMNTLYKDEGGVFGLAKQIANGEYLKTSTYADREAGLTAFLESQKLEGQYGDQYQSMIESLKSELGSTHRGEDILLKYNSFETIEDFTRAVRNGTISLDGLSEALDKITSEKVDLTKNINGNEFTNRIDLSADEEKFKDFLDDSGMTESAFNRMSRDAYEEEGGYYQLEKQRLEDTIKAKEEYGIVTEAQKEEVEKLRSELEDLDDAAKDSTAMILRMSNGVVKLREKFEDISEVLSDDTLKGTVEWYKALDELDQGLSEVLNIDAGTLSDTFLESGEALDYARRMAEGDMTAIDDLRRAASEDIVKNLTIQSKEGEDVEAIRNQLLTELSQLQAEIDAGTITVTTDLDDKPFIERLNELLANSQITAEQASNILSSMGVDAHIGHAREEGYVQAISYHPRFTGDALEIGENGPRLPGIEMVPEVTQLKTDIDIPYIEGAHYTGSGVQTAGAAARNPSFGNKGGGGKGSSPKKGSGSKPKNAKSKDYKTSEWDYLTDITNDLDRAAAAMEKLTKLEDRLYGKDKISNLKKIQKEYAGYITLLNKEAKIAERHAERLRTKKKDENGNLTVKGYADQAGIKLQYDKQGNIDNGRNIEIALLEQLNQATENYNKHRNEEDTSSYEDAVDKAQKNYDGFLNAFSEYEKTLSTIEEAEAQAQEYREKLQDAADEIVDAIQEGIDDIKNALEDRRNYNKTLLDWRNNTTDASLLNNESNYYQEGLANFFSNQVGGMSNFERERKNLIKRQKDAEEILNAGTEDADKKKLSQAQALENLQNATEALVKDLEAAIENYNSLADIVSEASDKMDELIDNRLEAYDNIVDTLDSRLDQLALLFGDNYVAQAQLYDKKIDANMGKLVDINTAIEAKQTTIKSLKELEKNNGKLSVTEQEILKKAQDEVTKLQKEQISTETNLLQDIRDKLTSETNASMKKAVNDMFGGNDVEWISQQWELATRNSNQYLDDYNRAFEIQKLQLKYQELLNDSQHASALTQQRITDSMNEQIGYLQNKKKISEDVLAITEYDVKYAEKQLEILQKQIALEEAQNNKSQMRLQRDAAGNYSFVYGADEDAVNQATQALLAAQQEAYNMSKQIYQQTYEEAYEAALRTKEMIVSIATDSSISVEERSQRIQEVLSNLNEFMVNSSSELGEISINLYNEFIEAEDLISEENFGHLTETFEAIKKLSESTHSQMEEDVNKYANQTAISWDSIENRTQLGWENVSKTSEGQLDKIKKYSGAGWTQIGADVIARLNDMSKGTKDNFLDNENSITKVVGSALQTVDKTFVITKNNSISSVESIQKAIETAKNKIVGESGDGGYLHQYQIAVESTLDACGSSYDSFIEDSLKEANSATGDLNKNTKSFNEDLKKLNGTIFTATQRMSTWKKKIDNAFASTENLIPAAYDLETALGEIAYRAADAADELQRVINNSDIDVSIDYTTTYTTYHNDIYSSSGSGSSYSNSGSSYSSGGGYGSGTTSTPTYWAVSDSNGLKSGKKGFSSYSSAQTWARSSGIDNPYIYQYDTGGYTGTWSDKGMDDKDGKLALLHQKELVLNQEDTKNMLSAVEIVRDIMSDINSTASIKKVFSQNSFSNTIEQRVEINATFPGVTEAIEIKQALEQLADNAYQVANKYKY